MYTFTNTNIYSEYIDTLHVQALPTVQFLRDLFKVMYKDNAAAVSIDPSIDACDESLSA